MRNILRNLSFLVLVYLLTIANTYAQSCTITQASSSSSFPMGRLTGQTFTACETAQLQSITFYYTNSNTSSLPNGMNFYVSEGDFSFQNSNLGFTQLASVSLGATELQSSYDFSTAGATPVTIDLADQNIMLTSGSTYGFVLENTGSNNTFLNLGNDVYAGGVFARYNTASGAIEGDLNDLRFDVSIANCINPITSLSEDFETSTPSSANLPSCWSSTSSDLSISATLGKEESQGLTYSIPNIADTSYIILPEVSGVETKKISLDLATGFSGSGSSQVKVVLYQSTSADLLDNTTNTPLDSITLPTVAPFSTLSFDMATRSNAANQGNST